MGRLRFLIIAFISFLAVVGEGILKKALVLLLCGLLGFNSMACFVDWDYGRVNAARPNLEESYLAETRQGPSEEEAGIKSISKWWATAGEDKLIDTTLKIEIEEKGRYQLNINIGGAGFVSSKWGLTLQSEAILKSLESNKVIEEARFGIRGEFTGKVEFSQELIPGNYEVKITNIEVPKKPIIERVDFILGKKIYEKYQEKSRLEALFIADRPEPSLDQSLIDELINQYAPILYFDKGELNEDKPELFTMPFSISETWGQHWGDETPQITGNSVQSIDLGQYTDNFPKDIEEPKVYEPAIYASISENPDESEIAINYYFHYPRSNWKKYGGQNTHQGDWEGIAVFLKAIESEDSSFNLVPDRVAFSQHVKTPLSFSEGGITVPWKYLEHPNNSKKTNVYVGLGAHASFPFRGITGFNSWSGVANQEFHKGDLSSFDPSAEQIHNLPRAGNIELGDRNEWLLFPGLWGNDGAAPRGPMFLDWDYETFGDLKWILLGDDEGLGTRWLDPWEWSRGFAVLTEGQNDINFWADQIIAIETGLYSDEERSILRGGDSNDTYTLKAITTIEKEGVSMTTADGSFIQDRGGIDNLSIVRERREKISLSLCRGQPLERDGTALLINYDRQGPPKYAEDVTVLDFFRNPTGRAEPGIGFIEQINDLTGRQIIDYFNNGRKDKSCEPEPEPEPKPELDGVSGKIFGDPHFITFDRRRLSFQAVGEFIQAKSSNGNFEVQGRYKQAGRNASLADAVAVKLGRDRVGIYAQQNPLLRVNGIPTSIGDELLVLDGGGQIYRDGSTYVIISPTGEGVKARKVFAGGGSLTVEVVMPESRRGQVAGLLGNFNGDSSDDIQTRSGEVLPRNPNYEELYEVFGNSWRISQEESLFDYGPGETTVTFTDLSFPTKIVRTNDFPSNRRAAAERTCREAGVTEPELLEACIFDILVTEDDRFARVSANVEETLTSDIEATPDEVLVNPPRQDPITYATDFSEVGTLSGHNGPVLSVAISPDNQTIVSGGDDKTIKVWDLATGDLKETLIGHQSQVSSVAISPDGKTVVSGATILSGSSDYIKVWDLATGSLKATFTTGHRNGLSSVAISPNGQTVVSGSFDGTIKVWDLATGGLKATLTGHSGWVKSVAISPDGKTVVSGSLDRSIKVWDLATGSLKATLTGHRGLVNSVAITPDGQTIISGGDDKTIKVWDLATSSLKATLTGHSKSVLEIAISSDGQTVASGSVDKTIKVWGLATSSLKATLTGHGKSVGSLAISPDGRTVVSGSLDSTIKVWNAVSSGDRDLVTVKPTGQGIQIFQFPKQGNDWPRKANPSEQAQSKSQSEPPPPIEIIDETGSTISICRDDSDKNNTIVCR